MKNSRARARGDVVFFGLVRPFWVPEIPVMSSLCPRDSPASSRPGPPRFPTSFCRVHQALLASSVQLTKLGGVLSLLLRLTPSEASSSQIHITAPFPVCTTIVARRCAWALGWNDFFSKCPLFPADAYYLSSQKWVVSVCVPWNQLPWLCSNLRVCLFQLFCDRRCFLRYWVGQDHLSAYIKQLSWSGYNGIIVLSVLCFS